MCALLFRLKPREDFSTLHGDWRFSRLLLLLCYVVTYNLHEYDSDMLTTDSYPSVSYEFKDVTMAVFSITNSFLIRAEDPSVPITTTYV